MHVYRFASSLPLLLCGLSFTVACPGDPAETESDSQVSITTATVTATATTGMTTVSTSESESESISTSAPKPDMGVPCEVTCEDGVCVDDMCCPKEQVCGEVCCGSGEVCSFQQCLVPGSSCVDASDCGADEYCEYTLGDDVEIPDPMCMGGVPMATGKCLPKPPECEDGVEPDPDELTCLSLCEVKPPVDDFAIELKHYWGGQIDGPTSTDVMMTPIVIQLDDDNCDGKVNEKDIPELVFSTFSGGAYYKSGTLHAISIVDGQLVEKWALPSTTQPGGGLAGGDLDGDGIPEIVGCIDPGPGGQSCCDEFAQNSGVIALHADGTPFWTQLDVDKVHCGYESPAIGDVDQDGTPEILVGWTLLDGATGKVKIELDPESTSGAKLTGLSDLDGDGFLDITDGQRAYRANGEVLWDLRADKVQNPENAIPNGFHGIGDFDKDGIPEVVIISTAGPHSMSLIRYDKDSPDGAKILRKGVDINNGISTKMHCNSGIEYGGGPPTVADFNGDGLPDIGAAGAVGYVVFDGKKLLNGLIPNDEVIAWFKETHDCSSAVTGSSVFDFNGDGKAEVIYSDEYHLWMYNGDDGENLIESTCNSTGTLYEYPLVADVDNDGQADIIVASNAYSVACPDDDSRQSGIRIFGSASGSWVRTRRIWNQHTYHVSNVEESGAIPKKEIANWTVPRLNNYRQNVQPMGEFSAPDLVAKVLVNCDDEYMLIARVRNLGQAAVPPGVVIGFYAGDPDQKGALLGSEVTTKALYPAEAEDVVLVLPDPPGPVKVGNIDVYVVVDDDNVDDVWVECRLENNKSSGSGKCSIAG